MTGSRSVTAHGQRKTRLWPKIVKYRYIYFMLIPVLAYYIIFHYSSIYYAVIAFQNYKPMKGISGSKFVEFKNFTAFLTGEYAWRTIRNTLLLNFYLILFAFTGSIVFALMINQMRDGKYKSMIQSVTYMPHFISVVVICGMLVEFCESDGLINDIIEALGGQRSSLLAQPQYFRTIYVGSEIWQNLGWGTIIYLATLSGVDESLHEAATIDGAGRLRRIWHINIPALLPVIAVQLIMRIGHMMSMGSEKILLLYSAATYETADVISTYVYRRGLLGNEYGYGAAVGLFNSVINLIILWSANAFSRKVCGESLW